MIRINVIRKADSVLSDYGIKLKTCVIHADYSFFSYGTFYEAVKIDQDRLTLKFQNRRLFLTSDADLVLI